jgi:hypothetical protein
MQTRQWRPRWLLQTGHMVEELLADLLPVIGWLRCPDAGFALVCQHCLEKSSMHTFLFFIKQGFVNSCSGLAGRVKNIAQILAASLYLGVLVLSFPLFVVLEGDELGRIMFDALVEVSNKVSSAWWVQHGWWWYSSILLDLNE